MDEISELQATVLKSLANPIRLQLIHLLADGPTSVGDLAAALGISQPNVSQHLAVLRAAGLVDVDRGRREARYRLSDPDVLVACSIMRSLIERRLTRLARLADDVRLPRLHLQVH